MAAFVSSPSSVSCLLNAGASSSRRFPAARALGRQDQGLGICSTRHRAEVAALGASLLSSSVQGTPLHRVEKQKQQTGNTRRANVVRASTIGVVQEVQLVSEEPLFYNVRLTVPPTSEVTRWYTTPGQYATLLPVKSQFSKGASFFLASPVLKGIARSGLEFLIEDVPDTVANEIINSKPGDGVVITPDLFSTGFDLSKLNVEESQSVLMFASSYGIAPFRALIETGFAANERKHAILYALYKPEQTPYTNRFPMWEQTGVKVLAESRINKIIETDPASTLVLMVASTTEQEALAKYFEKRGVSEDRILTLFSGIPSSDRAYYNKVLQQSTIYPKFPHHAEKYVPVELAI